MEAHSHTHPDNPVGAPAQTRSARARSCAQQTQLQRGAASPRLRSRRLQLALTAPCVRAFRLRFAVFFDVSIGGLEAGRMKMELFKDIAPKTAENFRCAACGLRRLAQP